MKIVFKYELTVQNEKIDIPFGAKFLHFGEQNQRLYAWFQFDEDQTVLEQFYYLIAITGYTKIPDHYKFYQTCQTKDGTVWHLFSEF